MSPRRWRPDPVHGDRIHPWLPALRRAPPTNPERAINLTKLPRVLLALLACLAPTTLIASTQVIENLHWTRETVGIIAVVVFVVSYLFVAFEERTGLKKSKPVLIAASLIWGLIALQGQQSSAAEAAAVQAGFRIIFLDFAELFFFLVVAMSFVSAISERNIFEALRANLASHGFSYRQLFWLTGIASFFLSPLVDNLTTALVMSGVLLAVGKDSPRFVAISFVNLVVAANAGGAWSAFGDITTLMVWQAHKVEFLEFLVIFVPSLVSWLIPAAIMHFSVPARTPEKSVDDADIRPGGLAICVLFGITIVITVVGKQFLGLPAVFGMMAGLSLLNLLAYWIARRERLDPKIPAQASTYSIFKIIANAEWDTLLFFYGVLLSVGGLAALGYIELLSVGIYDGWGHTWANIGLGLLSAIVDNIPIMYAVLQMSPAMDHGQWLLITLTCGIGGSLLAVGSAAGVALMGRSKGAYTFFTHLRWTWAIALGYVAGVATHLAMNAHHFTNGVWR